MKDYNSFIIPQSHLDYFYKEKRILYRYKYFKKHGKFPTEEQVKDFTIPKEEIESFKQMVYANYCENDYPMNSPTIPNNPVIPDNSDNDKPNEEYDEWFTMTYNITTTSEPTKLFTNNSVNSIGTMKIDGEICEPVYEYKFNTLGNHKVCVLLKDTTRSGSFMFQEISQLKELIIPCSINYLNYNFLKKCKGIERIICYSINPPSIQDYGSSLTFYDINKYGVLVVPKNSDYSSWFRNSNIYDYTNLYNYNWTIEYLN